MIGLNKQSLLFPRIVFVREGRLISKAIPQYDSNPPPIEGKTTRAALPRKDKVLPTRIYRLDWTDIERIKTDRVNEWVKKNHPDRPMPLVRTFIPRSYMDRMDKLEFSIPDGYMKAINHMCLMAMQEWEQKYPFDTVVREACYKSVTGYIESAFYLLSDCIYDSYREYYTRDYGPATVFKHMGMLRFWREQTGLFPAFERAGFQAKCWEKDSWQPYAYPEIDAMHHDMRDFLDLVVADHQSNCPVVEMPIAKQEARKPKLLPKR